MAAPEQAPTGCPRSRPVVAMPGRVLPIPKGSCRGSSTGALLGGLRGAAAACMYTCTMLGVAPPSPSSGSKEASCTSFFSLSSRNPLHWPSLTASGSFLQAPLFPLRVVLGHGSPCHNHSHLVPESDSLLCPPGWSPCTGCWLYWGSSAAPVPPPAAPPGGCSGARCCSAGGGTSGETRGGGMSHSHAPAPAGTPVEASWCDLSRSCRSVPLIPSSSPPRRRLPLRPYATCLLLLQPACCHGMRLRHAFPLSQALRVSIGVRQETPAPPRPLAPARAAPAPLFGWAASLHSSCGDWRSPSLW